MPGIPQVSICNKTHFMRNLVDNFEENVDAHSTLCTLSETFFLCKVLRGVRNHCLPSFLSAERQVENEEMKKSALHTMAFSENY